MTRPLTPLMVQALRNLADGEMKHGAYCLPRMNSHARNAPLRVLKERGLIHQIRSPNWYSTSKDVEWKITDAGRDALKTL